MKTVYAYQLNPDRAGWGELNSIEATHSWKVPGVRCQTCGAWATTGIIYPSVNTSSLNGSILPTNSLPIAVEQFTNLAAGIEHVLGADRPLKPGTDLGPLRGNAKGRFGDFAWVNPWTPLLRESVWLALREAGIDIAGVRAELDFGHQAEERLIELEAHPRVSLPDSIAPEKCEICGRLPVKKPDTITIAAASYESSIPLQRISEIPTVLVANKFLAQYIQERNLRDVVLTPIEVH